MFKKDYWIICDECYTSEWCDGNTQAEAAEYARKELGWTTGTRDLCPQCCELTTSWARVTHIPREFYGRGIEQGCSLRA